MRQLVTIIGICSLGLYACGENANGREQQAATVSQSSGMSSGPTKSKTIGTIQLTARYVSTEELVQTEIGQKRDYTSEQIDSLRDYYSQSKTFVLTIAPNEDKMSGDVMYYGVTKPEEYRERVNHMHFDIEHYVTLETDSHVYHPVLSHMEPIYGLKESRDIRLVFVPDESTADDFFNAETFDFVFDDEVFGTGMNHFMFTQQDFGITQTKEFKKN